LFTDDRRRPQLAEIQTPFANNRTIARVEASLASVGFIRHVVSSALDFFFGSRGAAGFVLDIISLSDRVSQPKPGLLRWASQQGTSVLR